MLGTEKPAKICLLCDSDFLNGADEEVIMVSRNRNLKLIMECCYFPREKGSNPQGEDSHFICKEEQVFGVAVGVGSWAKNGIHAGQYAWELMLNSATAVRDGLKGCVNPLTVLKEAYSKAKALGSSTACIVALTHDNCLHYANIGDSGFIVIRGDSVIYRSQTLSRNNTRE